MIRHDHTVNLPVIKRSGVCRNCGRNTKIDVDSALCRWCKKKFEAHIKDFEYHTERLMMAAKDHSNDTKKNKKSAVRKGNQSPFLEYGSKSISNLIRQKYLVAQADLNNKERQLCSVYIELEDPTQEVVATELGISQQAVSKKLEPLIKKLLQYPETDPEPEFLEIKYDKYREIKTYRIWKNSVAKEIPQKEFDRLKSKLNVIDTRLHKPSAAAQWWDAKISSFSKDNGIDYLEAFEKLHNEIWQRWCKVDPECSYPDLECKFCGSFLPYGEILKSGSKGIEGRKISKGRKYCSDKCATYFKRYN